MKKLRFKEISFLSYSSRKARRISLDSDIVIIKGDTDTGKSCISKSLFSALGTSIKSIPETWKNDNIVVLLKFTVDDINFTALHIGKDYYIFNPDGTQRTLTDSLAKQGKAISGLLDINLPKIEINGIKQTFYSDFGSFIAQVSWSALYVCVSAFYLLQLFLLYPIERTEATRSERSEKGRFDAAKMFRRETWRVGESAFAILLLLIGTSMLDGFYGSYYNLNQLVFDAFHAPVSIIGIFFGASYAVNATAYIAADFFSSRFGKRNTMLGSMLIEAGLFLILPWLASNPLCLFGLSMVLCFLPEVVYITSENLIQDAIADDLRATILSVASLVRAFFSAMFFSIFGYVLGLYPIQIG